MNETKEGVPETPRGVRPQGLGMFGRPKRKRGFYRALKAKKEWAVLEAEMQLIMDAFKRRMQKLLFGGKQYDTDQ